MIDTVRKPLDQKEWLYTKEAAYQLTTNRTEAQRPTWVAVVGYIGAIAGAFVRTKIQRENNQTSHTIAVVSLLSYFVALVLISSTIGVFRSVPDALHTLQRLRQNIATHRRESGKTTEPDLFPRLPRVEQSQSVSWNFAANPGSFKHDPDSEEPDLGNLGNWLEAYISTAKLLWICTTVKDFLFSGFIAGSILAIQIGVLNSCWCRANVLTNHEAAGVNLGPLEDDEWNRNWKVWPSATVSGFVLMITFGYLVHILEFRRGRITVVNGVLCKGESERNEDLQEIELLRLGCSLDHKDARAIQASVSEAATPSELHHCEEAEALDRFASLRSPPRAPNEPQGYATTEKTYHLKRVSTR
ncbi:hypothetical protein GP486_004396 [Trichoglossum hirsutum]|uniref:Uncharacterized protein n=1 Tax=Trichoglossum hirsutum TaxID=265104 RepID=A0A9P8LB93_9PEZI|nr:hypothetical protein GP486_004396 [Trichoglossum hirsutum]